MKKLIAFSMLLLWILPLRAQEAKKPDSVSFYRLDYVMYELEDGKRTNERTFTINAATNRRSTGIRVGTRVPLPGGDKGVIYMDVGLRINATLDNTPDGLMLQSRVDLNSVVPPGDTSARSNEPLLRGLEAESWNQLTLGKPILISVIDDVNSKKRFQIEVTASKAK
jgi:hypothetical protein